MSQASFQLYPVLTVQDYLNSQLTTPETIMAHNAVPIQESQIEFDEGDLFQCGRCKEQYSSIILFMQHKQGCGRKLLNELELEEQSLLDDLKNQVGKERSPDDPNQIPDFDEAEMASQVLTSVDSESKQDQLTSTYVNAVEIPASMVIGEETLSFSIPIEQSESLRQLVAGTRENTSQVLSVSEGDLANLLNCKERYHLSSLDSIANPIQILTTTLIRGKDTGEIAISMREGINKIELNTLEGEQIPIREYIASPIEREDREKFLKAKESQGIERDKIENNAPVDPKEDSPEGESDPTKKKQKQREKKKCDYCGRLFKKLFNLQQHVRSHTGEKPYHCLVCGRGFTQKSNVKKHMQTHKVWPKVKETLPKEQIQIKSNDSDPLESDLNLSSEKNLQYVVNNVYVCQYCDNVFESYPHLKTHMIVHKNEKLFKCIHKDCASTFTEVEDLIEHMKQHMSEIQFKCQQCTKVFKNLYDLGAHQYVHRMYPNKVATQTSKQYRCNKCNGRYSSSEALNHHLINSTHNYPCSQCRLVFVCERYLRRHLRIHGTEAPYVCNLCGKQFKTENYLKSHTVIHSDSRPFECETCGALFNRRDKLTRHKLIHENMTRFKCPFKNTGCTREFYRKDKLKDHMLSHSKKVHICINCGKTFLWQSKLRHHQITAHPEMHVHTTCEICEKIFRTKHHLKIHVCRGPEGQQTTTRKPKKGNTAKTRKEFEKCQREDEGNYDQLVEVDERLNIYEDIHEGIPGPVGKDTMLSAPQLGSWVSLTHPDDAEILSRFQVGPDEPQGEEEVVDVVIGGSSDLTTIELNFETTISTPMENLICEDIQM